MVKWRRTRCVCIIYFPFSITPFNLFSRPPYENDQQYWADQPRKAARQALKAVGLSSSYELGVLAQVIEHLRSELEPTLDITVHEAVFAASHLVALYKDDLQDAADHVGIKYITPKDLFKPFLWETAAAYAGHGFGLGKHWRDDDKCWEEEGRMPRRTILAVHYSQNALTVSLAKVSDAISAWEPDYRHIENFTLGSDAIKRYSDTEDYWADVKDALLSINTQFPLFPKPSRILLTGNMAYGYFVELLESTMQDYLGTIPPLLANNTCKAAAQGAAEFKRRAAAPWSS